jgi:MFS family permease
MRGSNGTIGSPPTPSESQCDDSHDGDHVAHETPLPKSQLAVLAIIALAEQTALNSISPYLPAMASTFPEVEETQIGLYVGLIASSFALAQFATNFLWGWLSDRIGRKPVVLIGTLLTAVGFVAFGFCRTLWQAVLVQVFMGLINGNQGVISTCLGEITDRSNQSRAFTYLPVIYGLGGITGPLVGGLLVFQDNPFRPGTPNPYPYLLPNLFSAVVLLVDFVVTAILLQESLEAAKDLPPISHRIRSLFAWIWQFTSASRPTYVRRAGKGTKHASRLPPSRQPLTGSGDHEDDEGDSDESDESSRLLPSTLLDSQESIPSHVIFTRDTILLLVSYLIFQLSNVSYNSLYPIFSEAKPPIGRALSPGEIGTSLAFAGAITIVFQVGIFGKLREKMGNKATYRAGLAGFAVAFILMPWIGYKDGGNGAGRTTQSGKIWLWIELGAVLIIKTVASVGGLTSALLLITNTAPSHAVLGTLNGLAQTLSAGGRAAGPLVSGALFTAATEIHPKGEAMVFGVFGGIAFLGFLMSFGIRSPDLEAEGWNESDDENDEEEGSDADGDSIADTPTRSR